MLVMILGIAGACSSGCSAAGSFSTTSDSSGFGTTATTAAQDSSGPCNGNPCIGDWQSEAAEGGTVVQCVDGTWSHAGGLSGACSDHGGETSSAPPSGSEAATTDQVTPDASGGGGPCDGNPCIGDWQKEAAEGGTVVQCADGTWSHAGGISGACSYHGGEGGPGATTETAPDSGAATSGSAGNGLEDLPVQCGYGVAGSSGMTCTFANNAFYEYWQAAGGDPTSGENVSVWSAEAGQSYPLSCAVSGSVVDCTGTNGSGIALDARFTQSALSAYTSSQATAYAASGKLGPDASQSTQSGSQFSPGDEDPNDASASKCESTMEVGPHSDCFVAQKVAADLAQGVWSAPGSDTVTEGADTITFTCSVIGRDDTQSAQPSIYRCVGTADSQDWFEFEFT